MSDLNTKANGSAKEAAVAARAMATTKFNSMLEVDDCGRTAIKAATADHEAAIKTAAEAKTAAESAIRKTMRMIKASESLTPGEKNLRMLLINDGRIKRPSTFPTDIAETIIAKIAAAEAEEWARTTTNALSRAKSVAENKSYDAECLSRAADRAALDAEAACEGCIDDCDVNVDDGDGDEIDDGDARDYDKDDDDNDDDDDSDTTGTNNHDPSQGKLPTAGKKEGGESISGDSRRNTSTHREGEHENSGDLSQGSLPPAGKEGGERISGDSRRNTSTQHEGKHQNYGDSSDEEDWSDSDGSCLVREELERGEQKKRQEQLEAKVDAGYVDDGGDGDDCNDRADDDVNNNGDDDECSTVAKGDAPAWMQTATVEINEGGSVSSVLRPSDGGDTDTSTARARSQPVVGKKSGRSSTTNDSTDKEDSDRIVPFVQDTGSHERNEGATGATKKDTNSVRGGPEARSDDSILSANDKSDGRPPDRDNPLRIESDGRERIPGGDDRQNANQKQQAEPQSRGRNVKRVRRGESPSQPQNNDKVSCTGQAEAKKVRTPDPYLRYRGGSFRYQKTNKANKQMRYSCIRYCAPNSGNPQEWTNYKRAVKLSTEKDPKANVVGCKGEMFVPVEDGIKGVPWFPGAAHECGWAVPKLQVGQPSDRNTLELFQPSTGGLVSPKERRAITTTLEGSNIWSSVTGGGVRKREYAKNLSDDPAALTVVTKAMKPYVKEVQDKYPALIHVKYGALRTFPAQESQYSRHGNKLHSDYTMDCKDLPTARRPMSIIVALDAFRFMYLPTKHATRREMVKTTIFPGQMVMFTDDCLHSGGSNKTNKTVYRLFAYLVSRPADIPLNGVSTYNFSDSSGDATISDVFNESESQKQKRQKEVTAYITRNSNRIIRRPDFLVDEAGAEAERKRKLSQPREKRKK